MTWSATPGMPATWTTRSTSASRPSAVSLKPSRTKKKGAGLTHGAPFFPWTKNQPSTKEHQTHLTIANRDQSYCLHDQSVRQRAWSDQNCQIRSGRYWSHQILSWSSNKRMEEFEHHATAAINWSSMKALHWSLQVLNGKGPQSKSIP